MCLLATISDSTAQLVAFEKNKNKNTGRVKEKKEGLRIANL